ncbi:hypothetical protein OSB04_018565 [Centaurea solstitialis]|uniref:YqaJ viral recombinase domain-containing protein n=1 Tax=Centaurea solstitialis TaxID=347529 RepID=A0AA38T527_9ASTR|nr:hypothetical protein OSB04_018565 [Centaurea solstitialis]
MWAIVDGLLLTTVSPRPIPFAWHFRGDSTTKASRGEWDRGDFAQIQDRSQAAKMTNVCYINLRGFHLKAKPIRLPKRKKFDVDLFKTFSTCASPHCKTPLTSLVYRPQPLTLTSQLSPSDAPAQRSEEWFALRRDKLTTSAFSTALGFWKGTRRYELWHEKVFLPEGSAITFAPAAARAMEWGVLNESAAIEKYKTITGREVGSLGFATHSEKKFDWIGASPDGLLGCQFPNPGILEVKCPFNKGKPELGLPWTNIPFYYMPQVQGQMEVIDRDWVDLYCWTPNGSTIFRVCRDRAYWALIGGILRDFWWENVVPAREALSMGSEEEAKKYGPTSTHGQTELVVRKSKELASKSKLLCREIAGHIEFFRKMEVFDTKGTSWAEQWDPVQDPPVNEKENSDKKKKKKKEETKGKGAMKSILSLSWMKNLGKKSAK